MPFWNTAECEEVSHFNQLLQWIKVCSRMDPLSPYDREEVLLSVYSLSSGCVRILRHCSMTTAAGHRQSKGTFHCGGARNGQDLGSKGVGGDGGSSLLVYQEFVSQLNPITTQSSTNLAIYIYRFIYILVFTVYKVQSTIRDAGDSSLNTKSVSRRPLCVDFL